MGSVSIKNFTRRDSWAGLPFEKVAGRVLPGWDISLVFAGAKRARALNQSLRGKSYTPNVLSYVVGQKSGEIIICPAAADKQAPHYNLPPATYTLYLFIHGLLHLEGRAHGATMERREQTLLADFVPVTTPSKKDARPLFNNVTSHSNRNRHRHVPGQAGRR